MVCPKYRRRHNNIYIIFITVLFQVRLITDKINPLQFGSVFYERQADRRAIYTIFITVPFQFCSITDETNPFQSGSVFYERTKLTSALYKHTVIFLKDDHITGGHNLGHQNAKGEFKQRN